MLKFLVSIALVFFIVISALASEQRSAGNCSPNVNTADGDVTLNCNVIAQEPSPIISISGLARYQFGSSGYTITAEADLALGCRVRLRNPKSSVVAVSSWIPEGGILTVSYEQFSRTLLVHKVSWLRCEFKVALS